MKISGLKVEATPTHELDLIPHGNAKDKTKWKIRVYWSLNSGLYGYQVAYQVFKNHSLVMSEKTGGCGYCKTSQAFERSINHVLKESGLKRISAGGDIAYYLRKYHKGGNYYRCTIKQAIQAITKQ